MTERIYSDNAPEKVVRKVPCDNSLSRDEQRLFTGLFEHSDLGVSLVDEWGRPVESNPAFADMTGFDAPVDSNLSLTDAVHPEDRKAVGKLLGEMDRGVRDRIQLEVRLVNNGNDIRWVRLSLSAWTNDAGVPRFHVATMTDVTDLIQVQKELRALSMVDELTGLFNRRGFMTLGQKRLNHANRSGRGLLVLFADVDGMKWINDNLGHHTGDRALKEFSQVLNRTVRRSDVAARIGGDEFAVITLDTNEGSAARVVDRIHVAIEACNAMPGREYLLSCCLGVARYDPRRPCPIKDLLKKADEKMYAQKQDREDSSFKAKPIQ